MHEIIIVGAGGFGREVLEMLWQCVSPEQYRLKGFLAQDDGQLQRYGIELPVLDDPENYRPQPQDRFLLAIGHMEARRRTVEALQQKGGQFLSLVHPHAQIASTARLGVGAVIYPLAIVSNASVLDDFVHLNYYASVGHDCRVGRYALLAPYATLNGFVTLGQQVYVSTHATVAPGRTLGDRVKISANSACMQDVPSNTFVHGVPGRQTRLPG